MSLQTLLPQQLEKEQLVQPVPTKTSTQFRSTPLESRPITPPLSPPSSNLDFIPGFKKITDFLNTLVSNRSNPSLLTAAMAPGTSPSPAPAAASSSSTSSLDPTPASASAMKPVEFVSQMFDEHKNSHAILYSKYEDPYENETAVPFAREIVQPHHKNRQTTYRWYPDMPLVKPGASPSEYHHPVSQSFIATSSPTFKSNATEFLKKFNSEELVKDPVTGDVIGLYRLGEVVGMGAFSTVREGTFVNDPSKRVAIKVTDKRNCDKAFLQGVYREIRIWKMLHHENIVGFLDVIETARHIFVFCDLCEEGRLFDLVINSPEGRLSEQAARPFFRQIISALDYLHSLAISHGDIKLDNILLNKELTVKVCDFGFSELHEPTSPCSPCFPHHAPLSPRSSNSSLNAREDGCERFCGGTLLYCAPEVLKGSKDLGCVSDIWSAGVSLFAMVTGELPFDDDYEPRLKHQILHARFSFPDDVGLSEEVKDLISGMLRVNVSERLTIQQILQHPWLQVA